MSKYPGENVSIADRLTCLEQTVAELCDTLFKKPSAPLQMEKSTDGIVQALSYRIEDLERRLGPSANSKERKRQLSEAIDTPSDREDNEHTSSN